MRLKWNDNDAQFIKKCFDWADGTQWTYYVYWFLLKSIKIVKIGGQMCAAVSFSDPFRISGSLSCQF